MAEVLGIIASAIALGQGVQAAAKGTQWIASLGGASAEFCDLHNELITVLRYLNELGALKQSLEDAASELPPTSLSTFKDIGQSLEDDVEKVKAIVYEYETRAKTDAIGERKIPKIKWARERSKIAPLRDNVRKRRLDLTDAMMLLQTSLGVGQSQIQRTMIVGIESICDNQLPALADSTHKVEELVTDLKSQLGEVSATLSSDINKHETITETLLEETKNILQTVSRCEGLIQTMKSESNEGTISQFSILQQRLNPLEEKLEAIQTSFRRLENSAPSPHRSIMEDSLITIQRTLENINLTIQRQYERASLEPEQMMHKMVVSGYQTNQYRQQSNKFRGYPRSQTELIMVQTTTQAGAQKACHRLCSCSCHQTSMVWSSKILSKLIGSFILSYNSIPVWKPRKCNNRQCHRRATDKIQLSYMFPQWILRRSLSFSLTWSSMTGSGASIHLAIPRVSQNWRHCLSLVKLGRIDMLRELLASGKASPLDMSDNGFTLLMKQQELSCPTTQKLCFLREMSVDGQSGIPMDNVKSFDFLPNFRSAGNIIRRANGFWDSLLEQDKLFLNLRDEISEDDNSTIIIDAILKPSELSIEAALALRPGDVNARDEYGRTAIITALYEADLDALDVLLSHGADVNISNSEGLTPLHYASYMATPAFVDRLIRAGSQTEAGCKVKSTPLLLAAHYNQCINVQHLLKAGAYSLARDNIMQTALHTASCCLKLWRGNYHALRTMCSSLLDTGLDINSVDDFGMTPLAIAVQFNHVQMAQSLYHLGASLGILDSYNRSILHFAGAYAQWDMIQVLRDMKICDLNPDLQNSSNGWTAEDYFYWRRAAPRTRLDALQIKPTEKEVELFKLFMSEVRERYQRRNIRRVCVFYQDWSVASRKLRNPKTRSSSWRGIQWRIPIKKPKRNTRYKDIIIDVEGDWSR